MRPIFLIVFGFTMSAGVFAQEKKEQKQDKSNNVANSASVGKPKTSNNQADQKKAANTKTSDKKTKKTTTSGEDSSGEKSPENKKSSMKPNKDSAFLSLVKGVIDLYNKAENMQDGSTKDKSDKSPRKDTVYGYLSLRKNLSLQLYDDKETPSKDTDELDAIQKDLAPNKDKIKKEPGEDALLKKLSIDSAEVTLLKNFLTRVVLFTGDSIFVCETEIGIETINKPDTYFKLQSNDKGKSIRSFDLFVFTPEYNKNYNCVSGIYKLSPKASRITLINE